MHFRQIKVLTFVKHYLKELTCLPPCNCLHEALRQEGATSSPLSIKRKVKGICSHFHWFIKLFPQVVLMSQVNFGYQGYNMLCIIHTKLRIKTLYYLYPYINSYVSIYSQKPLIGSSTRWVGVIPMIGWMSENIIAICEYDGRKSSRVCYA